MKIGIDARCLEWESGGVARILSNMLRIWPSLTDQHAVSLYFENKVPADDYLRNPMYQHHIIPGLPGIKKHRNLGEQLFLPWTILQDKPDLFFAPYYTAPLYCPCPKVVVAAWDISYTTHGDQYPFRQALQMSFLSHRACRRAAGVVTCSPYDGRQIERFYKIPANRICVLQLAADDKFKKPADTGALEALRKKYRLPKRYILSMGVILNRRNVPVIIDAFKEISREFPDTGLVVAGRNSTAPRIDIAASMKSLTEKGQGIYLPRIPEEELTLFYTGAWYYICTSTVDGEALMLKEAMMCGRPVITSPLLEETIGGNGIILHDPTSVQETIKVLRQVLLTTEYDRQTQGLKGQEWVSSLSWEKVARDCLGFIEKA